MKEKEKQIKKLAAGAHINIPQRDAGRLVLFVEKVTSLSH